MKVLVGIPCLQEHAVIQQLLQQRIMSGLVRE